MWVMILLRAPVSGLLKQFFCIAWWDFIYKIYSPYSLKIVSQIEVNNRQVLLSTMNPLREPSRVHYQQTYMMCHLVFLAQPWHETEFWQNKDLSSPSVYCCGVQDIFMLEKWARAHFDLHWCTSRKSPLRSKRVLKPFTSEMSRIWPK